MPAKRRIVLLIIAFSVGAAFVGTYWQSTTGLLDAQLTNPSVVIDDGDAGFSTTGGGWQTLKHALGYKGDITTPVVPADPLLSASWKFSNVTPGQYRVYVTYKAYGSLTSKAPYTVKDASRVLGTATVNQTLDPTGNPYGNRNWSLLGTYTVQGPTLTVTLNKPDQLGINGVIVDATRIERVSAQTQVTALRPATAIPVPPQVIAPSTAIETSPPVNPFIPALPVSPPAVRTTPGLTTGGVYPAAGVMASLPTVGGVPQPSVSGIRIGGPCNYYSSDPESICNSDYSLVINCTPTGWHTGNGCYVCDLAKGGDGKNTCTQTGPDSLGYYHAACNNGTYITNPDGTESAYCFSSSQGGGGGQTSSSGGGGSGSQQNSLYGGGSSGGSYPPPFSSSRRSYQCPQNGCGTYGGTCSCDYSMGQQACGCCQTGSAFKCSDPFTCYCQQVQCPPGTHPNEYGVCVPDSVCGDGYLDRLGRPQEVCETNPDQSCPPDRSCLTCQRCSVCGDTKIEGTEECEADFTCGSGKACSQCRCINSGTRLTANVTTTLDAAKAVETTVSSTITRRSWSLTVVPDKYDVFVRTPKNPPWQQSQYPCPISYWKVYDGSLSVRPLMIEYGSPLCYSWPGGENSYTWIRIGQVQTTSTPLKVEHEPAPGTQSSLLDRDLGVRIVKVVTPAGDNPAPIGVTLIDDGDQGFSMGGQYQESTGTYALPWSTLDQGQPVFGDDYVDSSYRPSWAFTVYPNVDYDMYVSFRRADHPNPGNTEDRTYQGKDGLNFSFGPVTISGSNYPDGPWFGGAKWTYLGSLNTRTDRFTLTQTRMTYGIDAVRLVRNGLPSSSSRSSRSSSSSSTGTCGNGQLDPGEQCDPWLTTLLPQCSGQPCNPVTCQCPGTSSSAASSAASSAGTCAQEGEVITEMNMRQCCTGLTTRPNVAPNTNGQCPDAFIATICVRCPNLQCGIGENYCNCPADCTQGSSASSAVSSSRSSGASSSAAATCGNGQLDPGEQCDPWLITLLPQCGGLTCNPVTCQCPVTSSAASSAQSSVSSAQWFACPQGDLCSRALVNNQCAISDPPPSCSPHGSLTCGRGGCWGNCFTCTWGSSSAVSSAISSSATCIAEGKTGPQSSFTASCCAGLTRIHSDYINESGRCSLVFDTFTCAKCGTDGRCGVGENKCNCPDDCSGSTNFTSSATSVSSAQSSSTQANQIHYCCINGQCQASFDSSCTTNYDACKMACAASSASAASSRSASPSAICGNGNVEPPEKCDDGNSAAGDGCTMCNVEAGWTCALDCSRASSNSSWFSFQSIFASVLSFFAEEPSAPAQVASSCRSVCSRMSNVQSSSSATFTCGNMIREPGEQCERGIETGQWTCGDSTRYCDLPPPVGKGTCQCVSNPGFCGDFMLQAGEECESGWDATRCPPDKICNFKTCKCDVPFPGPWQQCPPNYGCSAAIVGNQCAFAPPANCWPGSVEFLGTCGTTGCQGACRRCVMAPPPNPYSSVSSSPPPPPARDINQCIDGLCCKARYPVIEEPPYRGVEYPGVIISGDVPPSPLVAVLSPDKVLVLYRKHAAVDQTVLLTTIENGKPVNGPQATLATQGTPVSLIALDATHAVIGFKEGNNCTLRALTLNGTTLTVGPSIPLPRSTASSPNLSLPPQCRNLALTHTSGLTFVVATGDRIEVNARTGTLGADNSLTVGTPIRVYQEDFKQGMSLGIVLASRAADQFALGITRGADSTAYSVSINPLLMTFDGTAGEHNTISVQESSTIPVRSSPPMMIMTGDNSLIIAPVEVAGNPNKVGISIRGTTYDIGAEGGILRMEPMGTDGLLLQTILRQSNSAWNLTLLFGKENETGGWTFRPVVGCSGPNANSASAANGPVIKPLDDLSFFCGFPGSSVVGQISCNECQNSCAE